jgi:hypothetical protein
MGKKSKASRAFGFGGFVLTTLMASACATGQVSDGNLPRWVEKTVAERQPTAGDKQFDRIGWVTDIRTAIQLGKEHNRPVFLYTGDGRINTGRC